MAQNITLMGASYSGVPGVNLPKTGGGQAYFVDSSDANAVASDIATGKTAYVNGTKVTGTNSGGGGGGAVKQKQINFIDYDGTILYAYTKAEINAMTSESDLPANPSHTGLTAQGWNWTLAQIKAQLTTMPDGDVWVGQMYVTSSGDTEIDVSMPSGILTPYLSIAVNGTVTVDWGDNTTADTVSGTSLSTRQGVPHTYANAGDYTISIHVTSGAFRFLGTSSYLLLYISSTVSENRAYANCVKRVRLGSGISDIGDYAFYYCSSLVSVTIPNTVTSIGTYAFSYCYSFVSISIPNGVTGVKDLMCSRCYSLKNVAMPSGIAGGFGLSAFYGCYSLGSIVIPSGSTSLENQALRDCVSLKKIFMPSGVTSIGNNAFNGNFGTQEYHMYRTTPPSISSYTFSGIPPYCKIYVPSANLNDYKTASTWSNYASQMVGE